MVFSTGMQLVALVTVFSLMLYFVMGIKVGMARGKFNVPAPATTGHPDFDRIFRVQMNTLEWLPIFLPSLWLFSLFVHDFIAAALGAIWIVGRYIYMQGYIEAAQKRSVGFAIQALATLVLLVGALIGILWGMAGIGPMF